MMKVGLNKFVKSNGVNLFLAGFQKFEHTVLRWKACACVWRSCRSRALSLLSFSCFSVPCEENNKEMIHKNHQKSPPLNWGNFSWKSERKNSWNRGVLKIEFFQCSDSQLSNQLWAKFVPPGIVVQVWEKKIVNKVISQTFHTKAFPRL